MKAKQRLEQEERNAARQAAGGTAFSVLTALSGQPGCAMAISELQQASGMGILEFADSLKRLAGSGYLTISGGPGSETAHLTKLGAEVAELARPA